MAFNKNELLLDRVRRITTHDLATNELLYTLSSIEEPSLSCTSEGEEVTDAIGAVITTLYRAKKATLSGTNSLINLGLAAAQYGANKVVASATEKIESKTYDILKVTGVSGETVKLSHKPKDVAKITRAYSFVNNDIATGYSAGSEASATEFVVAEDGTVTPPTDFTGKLFIEYDYETENAIKITNSASRFPEACGVNVYAIFRDPCNENLVYSGAIICPKAKINPESVEMALTSTGKHPFEYQINRDYCDEDAELFSIIVDGGEG